MISRVNASYARRENTRKRRCNMTPNEPEWSIPDEEGVMK
jgi:hypothetical protein